MTTASSPDLAIVRTGLAAWFAALLGFELSSVQWEDEPRSMIAGASALLSPVADVGLGTPEAQHTYNALAAEGEEIERSVGQPRVLSLSLKLDGYDQRLPQGVFFVMSDVATELHGAVSLAALRELGMALVSVEGPRNVPRVEGGRVYPRAVLDVRLGYTRVREIAATTWIEKIEVTSHMRDVDGAELPTPPNGTQIIEAP